MEAYALDWLNLLLRWLHVTAGIAWIGSSFYFIALDHHLLPPRDAEAIADDVGGESWEIHGGGFYRIHKYRLAPPRVPRPLHWFKWEAYTTWLSGFSLLVVLYYLQANTYLIDRQVLDISAPRAVGISLVLLALSWLTYDQLARRLEGQDRLMAVAIGIVIAVGAYLTTHVFSGRGAFLHLGAMIGTWMVANVFFVIIPGQRALVAARQAGRMPEVIHGIRGKQRSIHNNYLTLPVIFAMLSNHFPMTYGHPQQWLVLLTVMGLGAWVQHFLNLRQRGQTVWWIPVSAAFGFVVLAVMIAPRASTPAQAPVAFAQAQAVIQLRCVPCHSVTPTQPGFSAPPNGAVFDTPDQMQARAQQIYQRAVVARDMPLGNLTTMTDAERDLLAAWFSREPGTPGG